jgi:hypothetical protein
MKTKHYFLLFVLLELYSSTLQAQNDCNDCGMYDGEPKAEMATGFNIKSDSTFEFFFSYGALERTGFGTWKKTISMTGDTVLVLNSEAGKKPPLSVAKSSHKKENETAFQLLESSPGLSIYFLAVGITGSDTAYTYFNQQGEAILDGVAYDSLLVFFEFCPEHLLRIPASKKNNYFEIKWTQNLFEMFFLNYTLTISTNKLEGKHPVLQEEYRFFKNN